MRVYLPQTDVGKDNVADKAPEITACLEVLMVTARTDPDRGVPTKEEK